ncbi:hypothetical protein KCU87_g10162, partial [Aureobasidium melanogenum]
MYLLVTHLAHTSILLGYPWFALHDAVIRPKAGTITFDSTYCNKHCQTDPTTLRLRSEEPTTKSMTPEVVLETLTVPTTPRLRSDPIKCAQISALAFKKFAKRKDYQIFSCSLRDLERATAQGTETGDRGLSLQRMEEELAEPMNLTPNLRLDNMQTDLEAYRKSKDVDPALILPNQYHEYLDVFSRKDAKTLPPHRSYDHAIDLVPGKEPPYGPLYSMSRDESEELLRELKSQLDSGFIRASRSPAASPVLFVKKPGGGLRFCVDYRGLNAITVKNRYPLPLITETLARLSKAKRYTKLDIISAFNRLRIKEGDEWKTAFRTRYGLFEYLVMPFGLCNGPASFQNFINDTLREHLDVFCTAYLDDILIYSEKEEDHEHHVKLVLEKLRQAGLQVDITKCEFDVERVEYLGLVVTTEGTRMDPKKVQTILEWPELKNVKDVQSLLGFANFYRRFIYGFSAITSPLTALTKKGVEFKMDSKARQAVETLKKAFTSDTILRHFDPDRETIVETDASDFVSGGILSQYDNEGVLRPVAFFSKKHSPAECNYEIYDKELMAIVRAFETWRPELEGAAFPTQVVTDHKNLEYFTTTKQLSQRQARWNEFLSRFDFKITYRPGKQGVKPDALTRRSGDLPQEGGDERLQHRHQTVLKPENFAPEVATELGIPPTTPVIHLQNVMTRPELICLTPRVLRNIQLDPEIPLDQAESRTEDIDTATLWKEAKEKDNFEPQVLRMLQQGHRYSKLIQLADCREEHGNLTFRGRRYVPFHQHLRTRIIKEAHDSPAAGHPGRAKTNELVSRTFWWKTLSQDVARYVRNCHICAKSKHSRQGYQGWLRSLPVPTQRWTDVSMDYVTPTNPSEHLGIRYKHILVFVDRLTKLRHLEPTVTMEPTEAAEVFIRSVYRHHGLPERIVSDRGTQFTSTFWKTLCNSLRIQATYSTAWHPETDGQTENANGVMNRYLRGYVNYYADDWAKLLPLAEFAANNTASASTTISPFFANSGQHPRIGYEPLLPSDTPTTTYARFDQQQAILLAKTMDKVVTKLSEEMTLAQALSEAQENQNRRPAYTYKVGDQVWLNAKNLRRARPAGKLDHVAEGPFTVSKVHENNPLVVTLDLPPTMKVHPTFHASLLRPTAQDPLPGQISPPPDPVVVDEEVEYLVEEILDVSLDRRSRPPKFMFKVKWVGYTQPTFEPPENLTHSADLVKEFYDRYPSKPRPPSVLPATRPRHVRLRFAMSLRPPSRPNTSPSRPITFPSRNNTLITSNLPRNYV